MASPSFDRSRSLFSRLAHSCVAETEYASEKAGSKAAEGSDAPAETFSAQAARLAVCALGIQVSYLLWGLMQERIMTKPYETGVLFRSSSAPSPKHALPPHATSRTEDPLAASQMVALLASSPVASHLESCEKATE